MTMTEDIFDDMGFLVQELHKEWERTGAVKAAVLLTNEEVRKLADRLAEYIRQVTGETGTEELSFQQYIRDSREYSILFRLAGKVRLLNDRAKKNQTETGYRLTLDAEEADALLRILADRK